MDHFLPTHERDGVDLPRIETISIRLTSPDTMGEHAEKVKFILQGMMNRMGVSYHKYGSIHETFPQHRRGIDNAPQRIAKYLETGNVEWLLDAMNYLLIEFLCPYHPNAHFRSTDSDESPGAVNADGTVSHGKVGE